MNTRLILSYLLILSFLVTACSTAVQATPTSNETLTLEPVATAWPVTPPENCPVTQPPTDPFVPPAPYGPYPYDGRSWFGTPRLVDGHSQ